MKKSLIQTMSLLTINPHFQRSISKDLLNIESYCIHHSRVDGYKIDKHGDQYGYFDKDGNFVRQSFLVPKYLVEQGYQPTDFGNMFLANNESRFYVNCTFERIKMKIESAIISAEGEGAEELHDTKSATLEVVAQCATSEQVVSFRESNSR